MNKKVTKLLSVFLLAGAVGAGAAGIAGCKDNHVHNYNYEDLGNGKHHVTCTGCDKEFDEDHNNGYVSAGNGKHHLACTDCGVVDGADEAHTGLDDDNICDVCNAEYVVEEFACDFNSLVTRFGSGTKTTEDVKFGKFNFAEGVYFESSGITTTNGKGNVNTQKKRIGFTLSGENGKNYVSFKAKLASSGISSATIKLCNANGTSIKSFTIGGEATFEAGYNFTSNTAGDVTLSAGDYYIECTESALRIGDLILKEYLENAPVTKIEAVPGKVQYKVNDTLDVSGLVVNAEKSNGATVPLSASDYTTNASSIDMSTAGEKTVTVTYTANPSITTTFKITVVGVSGVSVNAEFMQKVYIKGASALDTANLVVYAQLGSATNTEKVASGSYTVDPSSYNLNTAGEYNVKITYNGFTEYVKITVIESAIQAVSGQVTVTVNEKHSGLEGAEVSGVRTFKSIGNAIAYLKASGLTDDVIKKVEVQPGTYREKITTDLNNLTLIGKGTDADKTELVYNVVEGMINPIKNSVWGLDAATLAVTGTGFKAYNIKISNDFDYIKDNAKYPGQQGAQGLALSIGGDRAVIYKCHLFGNQDTLYLKKGRSYFYETQIDGNIDFIFGNEDGIAYFEDCTIKAISRGGGNKEGYVTAMKGDREGKYAEYGYIFDNCTFTDDGKCAAGSMALGRTWGKNPSVAIINSKLSKVYSTVAYGTSGASTTRYASMNGSPVDAFFVECNNTGIAADNDGSIPSSIAGCTVLQSATNYTKANIFAATNGNVTWASDWNCDTELTNLEIIAGLKQGDITQDPTITVSFNGIASSTDLDTHINGLFTYTGTIKWNNKSGTADGIEIAAGTVIEFEQAGRVAIEWYPNSTYGSPKHIILEYIEGGKAKITALQQTYIHGITLNTADIPAKSASHTITYNYNDGETPNGTASVIDGNYLQKPADPDRDGYTFVAWHIDTVDGTVYNFDSPVTGALTLVAEWEEGNPELKQITEAMGFNFGKPSGSSNEKAAGANDTVASGQSKILLEYLEVTAVDKDFATNGGGWYNVGANTTIKLNVKAGLKVMFRVYTLSKFTVSGVDAGDISSDNSESGYDYWIVAAQDNDVEITLTCNSTDYIGCILVEAAD